MFVGQTNLKPVFGDKMFSHENWNKFQSLIHKREHSSWNIIQNLDNYTECMKENLHYLHKFRFPLSSIYWFQKETTGLTLNEISSHFLPQILNQL